MKSWSKYIIIKRNNSIDANSLEFSLDFVDTFKKIPATSKIELISKNNFL